MEENGSTGPGLPQEGRIVWPGITIGVACSLLSRHITVNGRRSSDQDYYSHAMVILVVRSCGKNYGSSKFRVRLKFLGGEL